MMCIALGTKDMVCITQNPLLHAGHKIGKRNEAQTRVDGNQIRQGERTLRGKEGPSCKSDI